MSLIRRSYPARSFRHAVSIWPRAILVGAAILFVTSACNGGSSPTAPEGAVIRATVAGETFNVLMQDSARIAEADSLLAEGSGKSPSGFLRRGHGGFNRPWSWHLAPETVVFSAVCPAEAAHPSLVEANLDEWVEQTRFWCPGATLVARVR